MPKGPLLLGVDGGGTRSRARLCTFAGQTLGEGEGGPANIRFGLEQSVAAIMGATGKCLAQAGLDDRAMARITACFALAGASESATELEAAHRHDHPFAQTIIVTDAHAACVGAHGGRDGGVIVVGTGTVGWAMLDGRQHRVGGWGFPVSDEGSGAWLGLKAARRVLWAHDGRIEWTPMLDELFEEFERQPQAMVSWMTQALPRDFAQLAPFVVEHAREGDPQATDLMQLAAGHIDRFASRLIALGTKRLALSGGLAPHIEPWLGEQTRHALVKPKGDALSGAVHLAREQVEALAAAE